MAQDTTWSKDGEPVLLADISFRLLFILLLCVTAIRIAGLALSNAELYYDEAQYWAWAREPAFGYFTKPPLIAWLIGAATAVCGDSPFCIRLPAPILHLLSSLMLYLLASKLLDRRIAFWSALIYATLPGTSVSSTLMSTDVPLLFFWIAAMLALVHHVERPSFAAGIVLGVAIGLGLNAKYAMVYLVLCIAVLTVLSRDSRVILRHPGTWIGLTLAAAIMVPNVLWNIEHGFATFEHTRDNANWGGRFPNIGGFLEFAAIQTVIIGPVAFAAFVAVLVGRAERFDPFARKFLLSFSVPVFALILAQALISRAHGNWAATAFPAAAIAAMGAMILLQWRRGLVVTIGINATALVAVSFAGMLTGVVTSGPIGGELAKLRGWEDFAGNVRRIAASTGIRTVVFTERGFTASMIYALRDSGFDVRAFTPNPKRPADHFEMTRPWTVRDGGPVLIFFVGDFDIRNAFGINAQRIEAFQTSITLARRQDWIVSAWRIDNGAAGGETPAQGTD